MCCTARQFALGPAICPVVHGIRAGVSLPGMSPKKEVTDGIPAHGEEIEGDKGALWQMY